MITELQAITFKALDSSSVMMLVGTVGLLAVSALVSGSEAAFFSLGTQEIEKIKESKDPADKNILSLLSNVDLLLATILVVNNLVNICIAILSANFINSIIDFGSSTALEFLTKMVAVTFLLLLFGEIAPKVFAQTSPHTFASISAQPLLLFRSIFKPLSTLLMKAGSTIGSRATHHSEISFDELADAVDLTDSTTKEERVMLSGILNFVNTDVQGVMRSRVDIEAIPLTESYENVKALIIKCGYSRIPVYEENLDNIRGVLYVKDLLPHINKEEYGWQQFIRKPYFVPSHKKINVLLEEFQASKIHLAIVVDEYGSTMGLVSLEDIIEEIVGEITDESDGNEEFYKRLNINTYIFEGKTHINDFERVLELDEQLLTEVQGSSETLAGLILEVRKALPKLGDSVTVGHLTLTVEAMGGQSGRRIEKIRVVIGETVAAND
ncbi:MAG: gliding motility-associated protein GldE [Rikenellaceae bacterium]